MKFIIYIYFVSLYFLQNEGAADFEKSELIYLSNKLHPLECEKLIDSLYLRTPGFYPKKNLNSNQITRSNENDCQSNLIEWNNRFPDDEGKENKHAREILSRILRSLGHRDLVNFIKRRDKRIVDILNRYAHEPQNSLKKEIDIIEKVEPKQKIEEKKNENNRVFDDISPSSWLIIVSFLLFVIAALICAAIIAIFNHRKKLGCDKDCPSKNPLLFQNENLQRKSSFFSKMSPRSFKSQFDPKRNQHQEKQKLRSKRSKLRNLKLTKSKKALKIDDQDLFLESDQIFDKKTRQRILKLFREVPTCCCCVCEHKEGEAHNICSDKKKCDAAKVQEMCEMLTKRFEEIVKKDKKMSTALKNLESDNEYHNRKSISGSLSFKRKTLTGSSQDNLLCSGKNKSKFK